MLFDRLFQKRRHPSLFFFFKTALNISFLLLVVSKPSGAQELVINEIMASNLTTIADNDGDFSDWIELFNAGDTLVNLNGYGLSDNYNKPFKWVFPEVCIAPGQYMLIWASKKNRTDPDAPLHTSYGISADGEEVILTHPDGTRISEIPPTPMEADISFGHFPDASGILMFFDQPTPGASNIHQGFLDFLDPPQLSLASGFYPGEQSLEISHSDPEAVIFYTIDGSIPTPESIPYDCPLILNPQSSGEEGIQMIRTNPPETDALGFGWKAPSIFYEKATVVRATAFREGYYTPPPSAGTYFIEMEIPTLSVASIIMDPFNLFDHYEGIYIPGIDYETNGYGDGWYGQPNANYFRKGELWEVLSHFSFFEDGQLALSQNVGVRIHGGGTRSMPQKSLRIYARGGYGNDYLNHNFFPDQDHNQYKRIIMRNAGQDFFGPAAHLRDGFMAKLAEPIGVPIQDYYPTILYLNGEYWGIQNIRERYDKYYFLRKFNIPTDKLDFLENNMIVKEGSNAHYADMINFIENNPLSDPHAYETIQTLMNTDNFTDYYITNIFLGNVDWPGHNLYYFRSQIEHESGAPFGNDGRWHWALHDLDFGFGWSNSYNYSFDMLAYATDPDGEEWPPNKPWSTFLIRSLLENDSFKQGFINRFADLLNTVFTTENMLNLLEETKARIEPEIEKHITRWGYPATSLIGWYSNLNRMVNFANQRPGFQKTHIINYFDLPGTFLLTLDVNNQEQGSIMLNRLHLKPFNPLLPGFEGYPWTGEYFALLPVPVTAIPEDGYRFKKWTNGNEEYFENPLYVNAVEDQNLTAVFEIDDSSYPKFHKATLSVYPNPATNKLFIDLPDAGSSFRIQILSAFGSVVLDKTFQSPGSKAEFDLTSIAPGIYFIRLHKGTEISSTSFIKL